MRKLILLSLTLTLIVLTGCGTPADSAAPATQLPPPLPTDLPGSTTDATAGGTSGGAATENTSPTEQPPADDASSGGGTGDTFGTSAVDALAGEYVSCVEVEPHPIGQQIATTYSAPYEEVMKLFCNGDIFDDIVIAYQTSRLSGLSAAELLDKHAVAGGDWDAVWNEIGLTDQ